MNFFSIEWLLTTFHTLLLRTQVLAKKQKKCFSRLSIIIWHKQSITAWKQLSLKIETWLKRLRKNESSLTHSVNYLQALLSNQLSFPSGQMQTKPPDKEQLVVLLFMARIKRMRERFKSLSLTYKAKEQWKVKGKRLQWNIVLSLKDTFWRTSMRQWTMWEAGKCSSHNEMKLKKRSTESSEPISKYPSKLRTDVPQYQRSTQTNASRKRRNLQKWMQKQGSTSMALKNQRQRNFRMEDLWSMRTWLSQFSTQITWITWMATTWAEAANIALTNIYPTQSNNW